MILIFFYVVLIFIGLGQDLTHLAHKEKRYSQIFLLGRRKILIAFCYLMVVIYDALSHG
jgi:hypothetical protein